MILMMKHLRIYPMKRKILFQNYFSKIKSRNFIKKNSSYQIEIFLFSSERLQAKQCLQHPWLTRRPKSASTPKNDETSGKKLSTKKLRRFVIRRRWQVNYIFLNRNLN